MPDLDRWDSPELEFLSNFSEHAITINDIVFKTVEHFFQWCKTVIPEEQRRIIEAATPGQAKRLGQSPRRGGIATLIPDWEAKKDNFMLLGVLNKYVQHPKLIQRLIATYPYTLVEGNSWHDNYWGDCRFDRSWIRSCERCVNIEGQNKLGKIHMLIRKHTMRM